MATIQTNNPVSLLSLPYEILTQIHSALVEDVECLHRDKDTTAFRQTCWKFYELSEREFYRRLDLCGFSPSRFIDLTMKPRPERYNLVESLSFSLEDDPNDESLEKFEHWVPKFHKLRELIIERVVCGERHHPKGLNLKATFPELRKCDLRSWWCAPYYINTLLWAPKLTDLAVCRATLSEDDPLPPPHSTALKHLDLGVFPCGWYEVIESILRVPAALQTLSFSLGYYCIFHDDKLSNLVSIIGRQQPNLEKLEFGGFLFSDDSDSDSDDDSDDNFDDWWWETAGEVDFTTITGLKELCVIGNPETPGNCFFNLPRGLETLRFEGNIDIEELSTRLDERSKEGLVLCPPSVKIVANNRVFYCRASDPVALVPLEN